jgi:ABC-type glycerol-3-phosphate transport system substrate-binding protein
MSFDLKKYLVENKLNEAEDRDLYKIAGQMISQVGLFTQENADELEAEEDGNLYRFFDTPQEKAELIKISEGYKDYLVKVKAMMDELMSDPMYQVSVGDAGRNNALEKAYYRAKNI